MTTELFYLACAATLTALLWAPYILDRFATRGVRRADGVRLAGPGGLRTRHRPITATGA